jgi:hypothetical protein
MPVRHLAPRWGYLATLLVWALVVPAGTNLAYAQPRKKGPAPADRSPPPAPPGGEPKAQSEGKGDKRGDGRERVKNFDFNALDLAGRMRTPQLLYFLERANEELERASLEKRSFIPHMVRSVEEEKL